MSLLETVLSQGLMGALLTIPIVRYMRVRQFARYSARPSLDRLEVAYRRYDAGKWRRWRAGVDAKAIAANKLEVRGGPIVIDSLSWRRPAGWEVIWINRNLRIVEGSDPVMDARVEIALYKADYERLRL